MFSSTQVAVFRSSERKVAFSSPYIRMVLLGTVARQREREKLVGSRSLESDCS